MPKAKGTESMLIDPVSAASHQRANRVQSCSALVTATSRDWKEVICQTMVNSPKAAPRGNVRMPHQGNRASRMPATKAISSNHLRLGNGTQLASSTDQMTTNRFNARTPRAIQPSEGRKNRATAIRPCNGLNAAGRSLTATASTSALKFIPQSPRRSLASSRLQRTPVALGVFAGLRSEIGLFWRCRRRCRCRKGNRPRISALLTRRIPGGR